MYRWGRWSALAGRGGAAPRSQLLHHQDHVAPEPLLADLLIKLPWPAACARPERAVGTGEF